MEREIVFDTETTGIDPKQGHRIVEIGCLELVNRLPTGQTFHVYLNPELEMDQEVINIHGITNDFVKNKPKFKEIFKDFLAFIQDSTLVAHNASFDMKFLNSELEKEKQGPLSNFVIDTLELARKRFPGSPNSLDALCRRYGVDNSNRVLHGALLDSELLAEVYLNLTGGRQKGFDLNTEGNKNSFKEAGSSAKDSLFFEEKNIDYTNYTLLKVHPTEEEEKQHKAYLEKIKNPIWTA